MEITTALCHFSMATHIQLRAFSLTDILFSNHLEAIAFITDEYLIPLWKSLMHSTMSTYVPKN